MLSWDVGLLGTSAVPLNSVWAKALMLHSCAAMIAPTERIRWNFMLTPLKISRSACRTRCGSYCRYLEPRHVDTQAGIIGSVHVPQMDTRAAISADVSRVSDIRAQKLPVYLLN